MVNNQQYLIPVVFSLELPRVLRPPFPNVVPTVPPTDDTELEADVGNESLPTLPSSLVDAPAETPDAEVVLDVEEVFCFFFLDSSSFSSL